MQNTQNLETQTSVGPTEEDEKNVQVFVRVRPLKKIESVERNCY